MRTASTGIRENAMDGGEELAAKARAAAKHVKGQAKEEMSTFFSDVEDLVKKVAHVSDADVARIRSRVEGAISGVRQTVEEGAESVRERTRAAASATDDYVRGRAWTAIGIAAAVGVLLGISAARRK